MNLLRVCIIVIIFLANALFRHRDKARIMKSRLKIIMIDCVSIYIDYTRRSVVWESPI